ncbi:phospho-sugar mutase [Treponema parvum]|uniref:Phospho-sugar mutase n=1 Tax=Treponema parvum TaxID=138851 RepID=A0A975F3K5_9SPIR|nr:phospho-sugar mutase [Treponema parvum]QTQ13718.1 phospho-sugar mutase [Treponema parvum]
MDSKEILKRAKEYIASEKDERFRKEIVDLVEKNDMKELEDRFYQNLEFGTAGLRGIMGGGTNRMNTLEINLATQGLANYLIKTFPEKAKKGELSAVIAYDSRVNSDVFAEATACILAANKIKAYLFTGLRPTPELSFAIRYLKADTGVVVTASHNPKMYNGYKAYWNNGAQVTEPHDKGIIKEVNAVKSVKTISKDEALKEGMIIPIDKEIDEKFWAMCKAQLFRPALIKEKAKDVKIVYTPLHGTGAMHVEKVLGDLGLKVITVPEQRKPDGNFPTVEKPNPEEATALQLALALGEKEKADCIMATDPDADRFGSAFPKKDGKFQLVTGNQMGALLLDYILLSRKETGRLPDNAAIVRTIVTSPFCDSICKKYGVKVFECLTGFKWIAAIEDEMESTGKNSYVFGFEESYGYKIEKEVFDKDGISAAAMCAEMTLYWRSKGKSVLERLDELYEEFGYFEDTAISQYFYGSSGASTMKGIMTKLREEGLKTLGNKKVLNIRDIDRSVSFSPDNPEKKEKVKLPKSNVLQFFLEGGTIVSARPSGTEPKIKFYINASTPIKTSLDSARNASQEVCNAVNADIKRILDAAGK